VEVTYGYNLSLDDGAVVRQGTLLNDRGGITIGKNAIVGSYSRIFSHNYAPDNSDKVTLTPTTIGTGARIASHSIVLAGHNVGDGEAVGTFPTERA